MALVIASSAGCLLLFLLLLVDVRAQLLFLMEPPSRLPFSNSSGARVSCAAHGSPTPHITWLTEEGSPVSDIPGIRGTLPNGTLWLGAFSPLQYRSEIHTTTYRCRAANAAGTVLSRDMRVDAVMDTAWDLSVQTSHALSGGTAFMTCVVSSSAKSFVSITRWYKDGAPLNVQPSDASLHHVVAGGKGEHLLVRGVDRESFASYSCEGQHSLTGEKRRSNDVNIIVAENMASMAPRIVSPVTEEVVNQGADIRMFCCAIGQPIPSYSWHREVSGRLTPVMSNLRISVNEEVLVLRRAQISDAGPWFCRAHNSLAEQTREVRLRVRTPLVVHVQPQLQVANSGTSVYFNCSISGDEPGLLGSPSMRTRWLHDGVPVLGSDRVLKLHSVARAHRGMYQCFAEKDGETAQATAELRLGDTSPELHYTFIEQALHPGPEVALHCAASGSPPPRFTWLLDGQPIEEHNSQRRITQYITNGGDVVTYLNFTSVQPQDGGRYTCRAHSTRGTVEHSTRLNIYGPPSIRSMGPVRVVAGENATIFCPYSGYPISNIKWHRGGLEVGPTDGSGAVTRASSGIAGELLLWPAEPNDAGAYSCRITSPSGHYAQKDMQVIVKIPPKIIPFSFPYDLTEGSSVQVLCGVSAGDKPTYFSWLKDGMPISPSLGIEEKSMNDFSFLIFSQVTSRHSGDYTCTASNSAAEVNHTARLMVKVAPTWLIEPQDVSALLGSNVMIHCAAEGYPEPTITWSKGHGNSVADFRQVSTVELAYTEMRNGSLSISPTARHHEGQYMCRAENGIGRGLNKIVQLFVNEPVHFEFTTRNMTTERGGSVVLSCDVMGDNPIKIQWTQDTRQLDLTTYRLSISEVRTESGLRSQLSITRTERRDSGVYRCRAENAYGRGELLIYLSVQEAPESPRGLACSWAGGRAVRLRWRGGYDGNARVLRYRLQYRPATTGNDWRNAPARDIPAHLVHTVLDNARSEQMYLELLVDGLRPATAYTMRLSAANSIAESEFSDPILVKTQEEAPSEPPHNVQVIPSAPGELTVRWKSPPQDSWNGELLGYVVTWRETGSMLNSSNSLSTGGWATNEVLLAGLKTATHYEVRVRAFNTIGAGPASSPTAIITLEGVPGGAPIRLHCEPMTSQSIRVWWEPPPVELRGGSLTGYDVSFEAEGDTFEPEVRRVGAPELVIHGLKRAVNYSVSVSARTSAGSGRNSEPVYCATHEDVPGPPADMKALAASVESVLVSWLSPLQKNGKIKLYTVYTRPAGRIGQHSHQTVDALEDQDEYYYEVKGLQEHQLYEFWVTASTMTGEGELSSIIARKPSASGSRIASFGGRVWRPVGRQIHLRCATAGKLLARRVWTRVRLATPPANDHRIQIDEGNGELIIKSVERSLSDNYTCSVRNAYSEDSVTWDVRALTPPSRPALRFVSSTAARIQIAWDAPTDGGATISAYLVEYAQAGLDLWSSWRAGGSSRGVTLERLSCGTKYKVRVRAVNAIGGGEYSDTIAVATKGGLSKAASEKELFSANSTCLKLNLLTWESNGCPVTDFTIWIRSFGSSSWSHFSSKLTSDGVVTYCELTPATWHHLKVTAHSSSGTTTGKYYFATLDRKGERIAVPAVFPALEDEMVAGVVPAVLGAATAVVVVILLLILVFIVWRRGRMAYICFSKGYEPGGISEDDDKSVEKRDNHRNCQQVYTSSPIKSNNKKEQQEMYEISPYATFSMGAAQTTGGGATGEGGTLQFRSFGRPEEVGLQAPARPHLDSHGKHRSFSKSDEYTLSRAMTLMVRHQESDTDSSGSPCADCTSSSSYRVPHNPGKDVFRPITDSSAESQIESCSMNARPNEKHKRRTRRHHTPTNARYQQRQDQERRDFTIHV